MSYFFSVVTTTQYNFDFVYVQKANILIWMVSQIEENLYLTTSYQERYLWTNGFLFQYALITPSIWNFFPFKFVRKFGECLFKNPGGNSSLGSVGVKNATRAIIQNLLILSFMHIIVLLLAIKRQNCELPMFLV